MITLSLLFFNGGLMHRFIYLTIGCIFLALGLLGVIIPILPTTPFLLVTSFCFAKGSHRFHHWFTHTKIYKNNLESFVNERSMTLKTKICTLAFASTMLLFPLIFVDILAFRLFIIALYIVKYYYFIFKIKTV